MAITRGGGAGRGARGELEQRRAQQIASTSPLAQIRAATTSPASNLAAAGGAGAGVGAVVGAAPVVGPLEKIRGALTAPTSVTTSAPAPAVAPGVTGLAPAIQQLPGEAPVEADAQTGFDDSLQGFTESDIEAALAQIEAEFGLTRAELLRDETMLGAQYRLLSAQLVRQRQRSLETAEAGALQRGLFRSGIFAEEVGDVSRDFAEAEAQQVANRQAQEGAIEGERATLAASQAQAAAEETAAIRRGEYTARLAAAGI